MKSFLFFIIIFVTVLSGAAPVAVNETATEWAGVNRVVAIGDIHGDYEALVKILLSMNLINVQGQWIGGDTHLVLMGDLVDGDAGSKKVLDLAIFLQRQALLAGGRLHALLGNHDLITASGDFSRMSKKERKSFIPEDEQDQVKTKKYLKGLFLGEGPYARWMADRPILVKINGGLYVHAGLDEKVLDFSIDELNKYAKEWVLYFQERGPRPPKQTEWIVGLKNGVFHEDIGPAFQRDFKVSKKVLKNPGERPKGATKLKVVEEILVHNQAQQIFIGHAPTATNEILLEHPYYQDKVISLDSRISDSVRGRLSALEIMEQTQKVHYFDRTAIPRFSLPRRCVNLFSR